MTIRYSKDHEWVSVAGDIATIGITDHAQEQLGDIVYVEVPAVGRKVARGEEAAVVESVKAASEVYAPLGGEVVEANAVLADNPALVNEDAEKGAWFYKLKMTDPAELEELMDRDAYEAYLETLD